MGKLDSMIKSETTRLAKREIRKVLVPLKRDIRSMKITLSQLRKTVLPLERFAAGRQKELAKQEIQLLMSPEELKKSRFSPRLVKTLRRKLKMSQKELAILLGVTPGAVQNWETGKFTPKADKKAALAALRKLGRTEVKKLLAKRAPEAQKSRE